MTETTTTRAGRNLPDRMLERLRGMATVERVFGEPVERDGTLVIPVAVVMAGGGGGGGGGEAAEGLQGSGEGGGFGFQAKPAGVYVIRSGRVSWQPAVDPARMVLISGATAVAALLAVWLMQRAKARAAAKGR